MKAIRLILLLLLAFAGIGDAMAHGGARVDFGFVVGPAWWRPWYYDPPYYPPVVIQRSEPPVYIERPSESEPSAYWYYCSGSRAYYPYVKECPGGWLRVPPEPAGNP